VHWHSAFESVTDLARRCSLLGAVSLRRRGKGTRSTCFQLRGRRSATLIGGHHARHRHRRRLPLQQQQQQQQAAVVTRRPAVVK